MMATRGQHSASHQNAADRVQAAHRVTKIDRDALGDAGCDPKDLPGPHHGFRDWSDVGDLSAGFTIADGKIRERVRQLVDELARRQKFE